MFNRIRNLFRTLTFQNTWNNTWGNVYWQHSKRANIEIQQLLQKKFNTEIKNRWKQTPLMLSLIWEIPTATKALIEHHADINARDYYQSTPLIRATQYPKNDILPLISAGANVNAKDLSGKTPLMYAASFCQPETLELLIQKGAKINTKDNNGRSAIMHAIAYGKIDNFYVLFKHHANLYFKDSKGNSLIDIANEKNNTKIVSIIQSYLHPKITNQNKKKIVKISKKNRFNHIHRIKKQHSRS